MRSFKNFIALEEKFLNAVGDSDEALAKKEKYKMEVWNILQSSYEAIGGIKGSGFGSPDDMLKIPMWKMGIRNGKLHAVVMYKDKGGRKSVACGSDNSTEGKWFIADIFKSEIKRSYGEKSKAPLGLMMKLVEWPALKHFTVKPVDVQKMSPKDKITTLKSTPRNQWPKDAIMTIDRYPQLLEYGYFRVFNGEPIFKVMFGSPGLNIK